MFSTRTTSSHGEAGRMRRTAGSQRSIEVMTSPVKIWSRAAAVFELLRDPWPEVRDYQAACRAPALL
jgi:hypothetical protein